MSTNDPARPLNRRAVLAGAAVLTTAGATASATASPIDPAFAAAEAERAAWEAFRDAVSVEDDAEEALITSPWDRKARVLIGEYTAIVRGPQHDPIPLEQQVAEPVYVHDHAAIDQDCDSHSRAPGADLAKVEARRARLHRELDEDAADISADPEVIRYEDAQRLWDEAHEAWKAAAARLVVTVPTTAAGLVAILDRFETYTDGCMITEADGLKALLATVRTFIGRV